MDSEKKVIKSDFKFTIIKIFAVTVLFVTAVLIFSITSKKQIAEHNSLYLNDNTLQVAEALDSALVDGYKNIKILASLVSESLSSPEVDISKLQDMVKNSVFDFVEFADEYGWNHTIKGTKTPANDREYYIEGMKGNTGMELVFNSRATHETLLMYYAPVQYGDRIIGSLVGIYQASNRIAKLLTAEYYGNEAASYLCRPDGRVVAGNLMSDTDRELYIEDILKDIEDSQYCTMSLAVTGWIVVQVFPENVSHEMVKAVDRSLGFLVSFLFILFAVVALMTIFSYRRRYAAMIETEEKMNQLTEELRLSRVKNSIAQMQPHFLYNALGSIREIILDDPQYASDLVYDFTTHLRACIKCMQNNDLIPFEQEITNINAYVNIEKIRFGDRLKIVFDTTFKDFKVVPLGIQPLVENSIRHGIYKRGRVGGTVIVRSFKDGDDIVIQVKDDGVGFDYEQIKRDVVSGKRDSTGMHNLIFRFEKMMGAKVDVESELGVGSTVTVRFKENI